MKYKIWDKQSPIYTPSGQCLSADEWLEQYSWAKNQDAKMIIGNDLINGNVALEFEQTKNFYKQQGANITDVMSDEEVLAAIEDFEEHPEKYQLPSPEERIIAIIEYMALQHGYGSFKIIQNNYIKGLWQIKIVRLAVNKNIITKEQFKEITGQDYE